MKIYFDLILLLSTLLVISTAQAVETRPDTLVDNTVQEVLTIIRQDQDIKSGNKARLLDLVENKVLPHFDFNRMTRLAMGKNWNKASSQQQQELVTQFRTLLVRTYYKALTVYSDQTIKVIPFNDITEDKEVTVKTQVIKDHGQSVSINYSMERTSDGWKVYDIIVARVSLVINYRSSFDSQIRKNGIEGLLKTLIEKNRKLDLKDKEENVALLNNSRHMKKKIFGLGLNFFRS